MNVHNARARILGSIAACAGTLGLALAAHAGDVNTATAAKHDDVVVRFADLNLNSDDGAKALYARLSAAAGRACGGEPATRDFKARREYRACYDRALEKAVHKVGHAGVQALHAVRTEASAVG